MLCALNVWIIFCAPIVIEVQNCLQVAPELHSRAAFSHIQFSSDGKLLLCVAEGRIYQLDAFAGVVFRFLARGS